MRYVYGRLGSNLRFLGLCRDNETAAWSAKMDAVGDGYTHVFTSSIWHNNAEMRPAMK